MLSAATAAAFAHVLYNRPTLPTSIWQVTRKQKKKSEARLPPFFQHPLSIFYLAGYPRAQKKIRRTRAAFFQRPQQLLSPTSYIVDLHCQLLSGRLPAPKKKSDARLPPFFSLHCQLLSGRLSPRLKKSDALARFFCVQLPLGALTSSTLYGAAQQK